MGLAKPYRFERTLIALPAAALAIVIASVGIYFRLAGKLDWSSPLGDYFLYLATLVGVAFVLAPLPRLAAVFLCLAALETSLGIGSLAAFKLRLTPAELLSPPNSLPDILYLWHPLLQGVPKPTVPGETTGKFHITSEGPRGPERDGGSLRGKSVVALFGASATFDAKPEGFSWPDRLQALLGDKFAVMNHGVANYSSVEHVVQTAFYERTAGVEPTCAVYHTGANDLLYSHVRNLDPGLADIHLREVTASLQARRTDALEYSFSPLANLFGRIAAATIDTVRPADTISGTMSSEPDARLEAIFLRNIQVISAINRLRGIRTLWIRQMVNRELAARVPVLDRILYPASAQYSLLTRINAIMRHHAEVVGDIYVDMPQDEFGAAEFRDIVHYTLEGSLKFATVLAPVIAENCRLKASGSGG
jgi:hypothetical protein